MKVDQDDAQSAAATTDERGVTSKLRKVLVELWQLLVTAAVVVGLPYGAYKFCKQRTEREASEWLSSCVEVQDPWLRYSKLEFEAHPDLNDWQLGQRERMSYFALVAALQERTAAAFDLIEQNKAWYTELLDKYPRDPVQRKAQLEVLSIVWPDIDSLAHADRLALFNMATRCHLQEAEAPVAGSTVLDCMRYGARSLGTEKTLSALLDSALLFRPLTPADP